MSDIAVLGISIDARQAVTQLDRLNASGRATAAALASLEAAGAKAGNSFAKPFTVDMAALGKTLGQYVGDVNVAGVATRNATSLSSLHSESLRGQRLVIRGLAADMAIFSSGLGQAAGMAGMLYYENAHLFQGYGGLKSAIGALLTPTNLLIGGLAATTVGAYLATSSWKTYALELDDIAKQAGATSSTMAKLQASAGFKGIDSAEFTKGMAAFSHGVYEATHNAGGLAEVLRANGMAAKDFESTLEKAADLIKNAGSAQQQLVLLQQMGLPATMQWVRYMQDGAAGIRKANAEAVAFGGAVNNEMLAKARQFDEAWNKTSVNFGLGLRNAVVIAVSWLDQLDKGVNAVLAKLSSPAWLGANLLKAGQGTPLGQDFNDFYKVTGAGPTQLTVNKSTVDPAALKIQLGLEQQRISLLGSLATATDAARAKQIEINLAGLAGVTITKEQSAVLQRLAFYLTEQVKLAKQVQFGNFDPDRQSANALRELQTLLADGTITMQQYAGALVVINKNLRNASESAAVARSNFEQLTRLGLDSTNPAKQLDLLATSSMSNIENSFASFVTGAKSAKDAFHDLTTAVLADAAKMAIRMGITGPLSKGLADLLGGALGGGGGTPGNIGGTAGILTPFHHTGYGPGDSAPMRYINLDHAPRYHTGVGPNERHAVVLDSESIFTAGQTKALGGMIRDRAAPVVNATHVVHNYANAKVEQRTSDDGFSTETIITPISDAIAHQAASGRGPMARVFSPRTGNLRG